MFFHCDAHAAAVDAGIVANLSERVGEQVHQRLKFFLGAGEILGGKGVDCQDADAHLLAPLHHLLQLTLPTQMALVRRQS